MPDLEQLAKIAELSGWPIQFVLFGCSGWFVAWRLWVDNRSKEQQIQDEKDARIAEGKTYSQKYHETSLMFDRLGRLLERIIGR